MFDREGPALVFTASTDAARRAELERRGVRVESVARAPQGGLELEAVLRRLAELESNEIWVEAGARLAGALLRRTLVDEFIVYLAPSLLGPRGAGAGGAAGDHRARAAPATAVHASAQPVGPDPAPHGRAARGAGLSAACLPASSRTSAASLQLEAVGGDPRLNVGVERLDLSRIAIGDSIAVAGVCLTAVALEPRAFSSRRVARDAVADDHRPTGASGGA